MAHCERSDADPRIYFCVAVSPPSAATIGECRSGFLCKSKWSRCLWPTVNGLHHVPSFIAAGFAPRAAVAAADPIRFTEFLPSFVGTRSRLRRLFLPSFTDAPGSTVGRRPRAGPRPSCTEFFTELFSSLFFFVRPDFLGGGQVLVNNGGCVLLAAPTVVGEGQGDRGGGGRG